MKAFHRIIALVGVSVPMALAGSAQERIIKEAGFQQIGSFANQPLPAWQNGFLVRFEHFVPPITLSVHDRNGTLLRTTTLSLPGSPYIAIQDVAIGKDGRMAVCGTARSEESIGAGFIAWIGETGQVEVVTRPAPFAAMNIAFDSEGKLWAFGREIPSDKSSRVIPPHDMVRVYGTDGKFLRSFLPHAAFGLAAPWHPSDQARTVASDDRLGIVLNATGEWLEISTGGTVLGRWPLPQGTGPVRGAALTRSNSAYLSVDHQDRHGKVRTELHKLNRVTGRFEAIDGSALLTQGAPWTLLLAADGESLVFYNGSGAFTYASRR